MSNILNKAQVVGLLAAMVLTACDARSGATVGAKQGTVATAQAKAPRRPVVLAPFQKDLLDIAFEAATAIPVYPHIKDRSRAQMLVVDAELKLEQAPRALEHAQKIDNWRRGEAFGGLAFYAAGQDMKIWMADLIRQASDIARAEGVEEWRRNEVRVRIAQAYAWTGELEKAVEFEKGLEPHQIGKVAIVFAQRCSDEEFDGMVKAIEGLARSIHFETVRNAEDAFVALFHRFYASSVRRELVERMIQATWDPLPIFMRLEIAMDLAQAAIDHHDFAGGLRLVKQAVELFDGYQWPVENAIPLAARLGRLRYQSGEIEAGKKGLDGAWRLFQEHGESIVNIYRASALRRLAENFQAIGQTNRAREIFQRAIEEGMANPNSRPRAEDLSATCLSMAVAGVEPDEAMWKRIKAIQGAWGPPW